MVEIGRDATAFFSDLDFGRKKEEEMAFFLSYTKAKAEMLK